MNRITVRLRRHYHIANIFEKDSINLAYSHQACIIAGGICLAAGLGPENNRRRGGTYEYYSSEPIEENDAKGLAPFLM